jgi:uncharacterized protein YkwD
MDVAQVSTAIVETANAMATSSGVYRMATQISASTASPIPTVTPIVITATITETVTSTETPSPTLTTTFTISPTNTATLKAATSQFTPTNIPASAVPAVLTSALPTAIPPTMGAGCPEINAAYTARVIELINAERTNAGLPALIQQGQLGSAAQLHSEDMACNNFFSHTGLDGSSSADRAHRQGYSSGFVGENIAAGYSSPAEVVTGWMNSPGHKANILDAGYTEIGIGYAFGGNSDYGSYWTAVFAGP